MKRMLVPLGQLNFMTFFMLGMLLVCLGCGGGPDGPERVGVTGTVTFDGSPIEQGSIVFIPADGHSGPSAGGIINGGQYQIESDNGPVPGPHRVEIRATRVSGTTTVKGVDGTNGGLSGGGTFETIEMYIPEKYNAKSTLQEEVRDDESPLNFELSS